MTRSILPSAAVLVGAALAACTGRAPDAVVYACNERGNSIAVISTRTNAVVDTMPVGPRPLLRRHAALHR